MESKVAVSVIIPVYNVEQYLQVCLDSIAVQTLRNIEIICVDDASTDSSYEILQKYAEQDSRCVVIQYTENKKQGAGRNTGMAHAKGEYIFFMDADDWLPADALHVLYAKASEYQLDSVWGHFSSYFEDTKEYKIENWSKTLNATTGFIDIQPENILEYPTIIWARLLKTAIIKKYAIHFVEGVFFEDIGFYCIFFAHVHKVYICEDEVYIYRRHGASTMGTVYKNIPGVQKSSQIFETVYEQYCKHNLWASYKIVFYNVLLTHIYNMKKHQGKEVFQQCIASFSSVLHTTQFSIKDLHYLPLYKYIALREIYTGKRNYMLYAIAEMQRFVHRMGRSFQKKYMRYKNTVKK